MTDHYGRQINYLRVSLTEKCNLKCRYCDPGCSIHPKYNRQCLTLSQMEVIIGELVKMGIEKIRLTGGEPLLRKGLVPFVERISKMKGLKEVALTTNGILLAQYADALKAAGLMRVNISLDSLQSEKYAYMTRGGSLQDVLSGIESAKKLGMPIKLNTVLIGGYNEDEILHFVQLTKDEPLDVRFIELMPIGGAANWSAHRFIPGDTVLKQVGHLRPILRGDKGAVAELYQLPGAIGRVGLIRPVSCKFCAECNRIRLTADGKLKYCLHSDIGVDLKKALTDQKDIQKLIEKTIALKPKAHYLEESKRISMNMYQIGG